MQTLGAPQKKSKQNKTENGVIFLWRTLYTVFSKGKLP